MKEQKNLEWKESVSNTFLKTVSAFANYGTGQILFGVCDDGKIVGIENPKKACLDIENRINDSIDPVPRYTLFVDDKSRVITLTVEEGLHKPYLYKSKAYRRNDTATIETDRLELTRLILEGQSSSFEELPARGKELTYSVLEKKMKEELHIEKLTPDTLKTLELWKDGQGANIAGELFADVNGFCGIDIIRFGDSINIMLDRETYEHESILSQYDKAVHMYRKYYQYEEIKGVVRNRISMIPEDAFREAVANALVHRTWDVDADINIGMYPDRIEISSPGGLPQGMTEAEYIKGGLSILRNRIIGNIFLRLNLIERFGTGIRRINDAYRDSNKKPLFGIYENSIRVTLPIITASDSLSKDENKVYQLLRGKFYSSSAVVEATGFGKTKTVGILKKLTAEGFIVTSGNGRGIKYTAK